MLNGMYKFYNTISNTASYGDSEIMSSTVFDYICMLSEMCTLFDSFITFWIALDRYVAIGKK